MNKYAVFLELCRRINPFFEVYYRLYPPTDIFIDKVFNPKNTQEAINDLTNIDYSLIPEETRMKMYSFSKNIVGGFTPKSFIKTLPSNYKTVKVDLRGFLYFNKLQAKTGAEVLAVMNAAPKHEAIEMSRHYYRKSFPDSPQFFTEVYKHQSTQEMIKIKQEVSIIANRLGLD